MELERLRMLLEELRSGNLSVDEACARLTHLPFEDIGFAKLDHHRWLRSGMPEVIFAAGKSAEQVAEIFARMAARETAVLATKADEAHFFAVRERVPGAVYYAAARCIALTGPGLAESHGHVAVVCAGTSDLPVAEEAAVTAELFGARVSRHCDVGVAGLHRLLAVLPEIREADVVIACAGMEGALPSVLGGLVAAPVIAVPTSVGYGASLGGVTALLGMLNSCSPNTTVVNIDNGFGAAYVATLIVRRRVRESAS
jgi:NCAIR mutase (PurE)-related protein